MESGLADKVFIVTGGASGMGLATATTLARRGARLAIWDINRAGIEQVSKDLNLLRPGKVIPQAVDVTSRSAVKSALIEARQHFGAIHGIVNFAGTGGHELGVQPVWETTCEEFDFIVGLNIRGLFNILGEALAPGFLGKLQTIVHVTSMFSERGYKNGAVFAATKHAAVGMVKSAAIEAGERGIRVNCLLPGAIDTPMYHQVRDNAGLSNSAAITPIPRPGQPQEVANVAALLLSDESSYVTGATWNVDGGANA
ncbi:oxidoreductase [Aspergillus pseudoustus]|uniref:Oxidoreductase n=1 Tax=Aspergillus pseudoustus TaxID=1810923 RepID=A0ABR4KYK4_9EURO